MYPTHQFKDKFVLFKIFFPILIYQVYTILEFVDTTMTTVQYHGIGRSINCNVESMNPFFTFNRDCFTGSHHRPSSGTQSGKKK